VTFVKTKALHSDMNLLEKLTFGLEEAYEVSSTGLNCHAIVIYFVKPLSGVASTLCLPKMGRTGVTAS
jgi:hypothetical protein